MLPQVCAWNGSFTYADLDARSAILASHLVNAGVEVGTIVPLCFEKSKWMPVAQLAVMKAGGASVNIDIKQPKARTEAIAYQTRPRIVLSSTSESDPARSFGSSFTLVVDDSFFADKRIDIEGSRNLPEVSSDATLYIVYTSGSTGIPKAIAISHSNFASSIRHQSEPLRWSRSARVFDYASYAFDVSWATLLRTLCAGGCILLDRSSH